MADGVGGFQAGSLYGLGNAIVSVEAEFARQAIGAQLVEVRAGTGFSGMDAVGSVVPVANPTK